MTYCTGSANNTHIKKKKHFLFLVLCFRWISDDFLQCLLQCPGGPVRWRSKLWALPAVAFCNDHSLQRLMNWLCGCCQCVCALGEGVPVTGGNPSYGIRPGAAIVAVLQGAPGGAGDSGSSSDSHTAVTPLETQLHSSPLCPPTCPIDQLRQKWVHKGTRRLCQSFLNANSFGWGGRKKK